MVEQRIIFLLLLFVLTLVECSDTYNEELYIKILPDLKVYSQFQFSISWDANSENNSECKLFYILMLVTSAIPCYLV
jgi:hypothetical protein